ncbi:MAG: hypothetical protein ABWK01_01895 [Infirmifilum sp.]
MRSTSPVPPLLLQELPLDRVSEGVLADLGRKAQEEVGAEVRRRFEIVGREAELSSRLGVAGKVDFFVRRGVKPLAVKR